MPARLRGVPVHPVVYHEAGLFNVYWPWQVILCMSGWLSPWTWCSQLDSCECKAISLDTEVGICCIDVHPTACPHGVCSQLAEHKAVC